ncbi:SPOR domain-containing protein [Aquisediminimonas sediminicola]|uniref:SPOR domain-containing protein n=1 Tax=Alteraquisediminimonas sediminicola TaxID=2676787 RepID=UPI001C8E72C0|nr:SPOR domain-containing protein [Aquisediminimonas sediminicola]
MKTRNFAKIALISALLGTTAVGCSTIGPKSSLQSTNLAPATPPSRVKQAAKHADKAARALERHALADAIGEAEAAVADDLRNPDYRALLGRAYLAAGRFASAAQSFQDSIELGGDTGRTSMNLALAQIAQGNREQALAALDRARPSVAAADYGLGLALAGNTGQAIEVLERAARTDGAGARERQNLALSYALAGRWAEARTTAAQDVSADELTARMEQWSAFARPSNNWDQVASLLKVTPHEDPGQPTQLALANIPATADPNATAENTMGATGPVDMPPGDVENYTPTSASAAQFAAVQHVAPLNKAEPDQFQIETIAPVAKSSRTALAPSAASRSVKGKYVVQIGAFGKRASAQTAWNNAVARYASLASATGMIATVAKGNIYRLSAGGFTTRASADASCNAIRQSGGLCFVRTAAGDAPVEFAAKPKAKATQIASR